MILFNKNFFFREFYSWFLMMLGALILVTLAVFVFIFFDSKRNIEEKHINLSQIMVENIKSEYSQSSNSWPFAALEELKSIESVVFWRIVKPDNEILLNSNNSSGEKFLNAELNPNKKFELKKLDYRGEKVSSVIYPFLLSGDDESWYFVLGFSWDEVKQSFYIVGGILFFVFLIIFVVLTLIFNYFSRSYHRSLTAFKSGLKALDNGELGYRIDVRGYEDKTTEEIIKIFNKTLKSLQEKEAKAQKKISDLEKFHQLTVGRELKMKELKEKIEGLKEELRTRRQW